ncbi:MAG: chromosome segregation protein SMC [Bacillota bacterium]|nr:MAG: chromosome segregation protein SMC [Bacillota bacterium]
MNFEKIEMFGFKSFADKQEIKFGTGITGIVGPNGCGKSNVADAIRWVMGEQSAKTLRGGSMQDVIFSGTQDRKSLSYCEVSLFFDNSNKMFSLDYNEVIITRKLFRSGESEYYINKQPARLRDIVNLLHECGIGKEGYTIIGQGKVQEIMSAKPEDRRAIFEEATGIAKFKTEKNESERKLMRTRENLLRFSDIMAELETQLGPLERQAEKARQFRDLSEELKRHEINTFISKFENVAVEKGKIGVKIDGINEESALREKESAETQAEYDRILREIESADVRLKGLNDELLEKSLSIEKSEGAAKQYNLRVSFFRSEIQRAEEEIQKRDTVCEENERTIAENTRRIEEIKREIFKTEKQKEALTAEILTLSAKLSEGENRAEENQRRVLESMESLSDLNRNAGSLAAQKSALSEKKEEVSGSLSVLEYKRNELFSGKEKLDSDIAELDKSIYELKGKIAEKEDAVRDYNEKTAEVDNAVFNLNSNLTMLTAKENFIVGMRESYEGYAPAVKRLMLDAKQDKAVSSRIKGVVASVIKTEAKYDVAMETALGAAAQNIVTADTDDAKYLIEYLKRVRGGRVTFLPVTSVKPRTEHESVSRALREQGALGVANKLVKYDAYFENVVSNLLGNTLIVDNIENATKIANKFRFAFKIVTLEGDVFSPQGSMTGGSRRQDMPNLLAGDRQVDEIREKIAAKRREMDALKEKKAQLEKERDDATEELSYFNDMYQARRQELMLLREKFSGVENALMENNKNFEDATGRLERIEATLEGIERAYEEVQSGGEKLQAEKSSAGEEAAKRREEYAALRRAVAEKNEESTRLQLALADLRAGIEKAQNEITRGKSEILLAERENEKAKEDIDAKNEIIEQLKRDAEKVALSEEEQRYVGSLRDRIAEVEESKSTLREEQARADERKAQLLEEISALADKRHAQELALTKIDTDIEYYGQRISEEYGETYESAQRYREEDYNAHEGEQEIARLKRKINSLGAINPNAIDDFAQVKERYDEMNVQKEDLSKAESDIVKAIDTLKKEMLSQFNEGFTKINENFMRIFKELFGGGRAMLQLDYEGVEDPLDAGVNIIAEPPGKKLQKLSLLSGGEQALTAIAILFSILRLRPMPFCVLDEIEAALDEANVDRFARYLKKFSDDTQFIVITHRKPTMELADALFGVTMQEKGVSKMVSVKLSDIEDVEAM